MLTELKFQTTSVRMHQMLKQALCQRTEANSSLIQFIQLRNNIAAQLI